MGFFSAFDEDEKKVLEQLRRRHTSPSMRVVGRGTLIKNAKDVRNSPNAKKLESALPSIKNNNI